MMGKYVQGPDGLEKRLTAIPKTELEALCPALNSSVEDIVGDARALAESSRHTGALVASKAATGLGERIPPFTKN